jgi:hypothetical protein
VTQPYAINRRFRPGSEVLLEDEPLLVDLEGHDARVAVFRGPGDRGETQMSLQHSLSVGGALRYWVESRNSGPEGVGFRFNVTLLFPK